MADGDPMVLETIHGDPEESLLDNGSIELWSGSTGVIPDGWLGGGSMTHLRIAGTRTGGSGSYHWRASRAGAVYGQQTTAGYQWVELVGNDSLDARGHVSLCWSVWAYETGADSPKIRIAVGEWDKDKGNLGKNAGYVGETIAGAWGLHEFGPYTLQHADCAYIYFLISIDSYASGNTEVWIDDVILKVSYTFAKNPSMPDSQSIVDPTRKFGRTIDGSLYMARGDGGASKFQKTLNFGLIGIDQLKALRSLWLLGVPCRWTPNQPHLPSSLEVRVTKFNFVARRGGFGSNCYGGSLELSEI